MECGIDVAIKELGIIQIKSRKILETLARPSRVESSSTDDENDLETMQNTTCFTCKNQLINMECGVVVATIVLEII